jgi:hypothetical protein
MSQRKFLEWVGRQRSERESFVDKRCWRPQTVRYVLVKQIHQHIRDNRSVWIDSIAFVIIYSYADNC